MVFRKIREPVSRLGKAGDFPEKLCISVVMYCFVSLELSLIHLAKPLFQQVVHANSVEGLTAIVSQTHYEDESHPFHTVVSCEHGIISFFSLN